MRHEIVQHEVRPELSLTAGLNRVTLENIGLFDELSLDIHPRWNVVLGDNGVGKTTILKAIAVGLCGDEAEPYANDLIKAGAARGSITLEIDQRQYRTDLLRRAEGIRLQTIPVQPLIAENLLALGFSAFMAATPKHLRGPSQSLGNKPRPVACDLMPLIKGEADPRLLTLKQWIVNLDYSARSRPEEVRHAEMLKDIFSIIDLFVPEMGIQFEGIDPATYAIIVRSHGNRISLDSLSLGPSALISWVVTLLARLYDVYGDGKEAQLGRSLVLIDEIEVHLHPVAQRKLLPIIQSLFPNIQLVATTHSPLIISSLQASEVVRLTRDAGGSVTPVKLPDSNLAGSTVDQILTSSLFGLETTRDVATDKHLRRYFELTSKDEPSAEEQLELGDLFQNLAGRLPLPPTRKLREAEAAAELIQQALRGREKDKAAKLREKPVRELVINRPLKVYAFDPSHGRNLGNYMTINVQYEDVQPGPVGRYLAVIDYDASNDCYYIPVDLSEPGILLRGGLDPNESDPRFHQQMVYAVASETIKRFEFALGRPVKWGFKSRDKNDPLRNHLRIFPHGMQEANAFYSRDLHALVFGYFPAAATNVGSNLPNQTVFTCLSHDIIVHEATHALVDGIRPYFDEVTGPDTIAFHEAFADLMALFQHFSFNEPMLEMIQQTGGLIHRSDIPPEVKAGDASPMIIPEIPRQNPLVELAKQFGEALGTRRALRSAIGTPPNSSDIERLFEPHARGSILVAAVFDAFFTVYLRRTRDLMRIAQAGGAWVTPGNMNSDLIRRLAGELVETAGHFMNICIRALDYCPPVDITFGDYLRALITAAFEFIPDDQFGCRNALIEAFRLRGIRPGAVPSYSEESLRWSRPEANDLNELRCDGLVFDLLKGTDRPDLVQNAILLSNFGRKHAEALGLAPELPVRSQSFQPVHRVNLNNQWTAEILVELTQKREVPLDPSDEHLPHFKFRGGTTLVLDRWGYVRYAIHKGLDDEERLQRQRNFLLNNSTSLKALYLGASKEPAPKRIRKGALSSSEIVPLDFQAIHRGD